MKHEPLAKEWEEHNKRYAVGLKTITDGCEDIRTAMTIYSCAVSVKYGALATVNWDTGEIETENAK